MGFGLLTCVVAQRRSGDTLVGPILLWGSIFLVSAWCLFLAVRRNKGPR